MMTFPKRTILTAVALMALTACGSGSTETNSDELAAFIPAAEAAEKTITRIVGDEFEGIDPLPGSAFTAIPTAGTADFSGPGRIDIFARSQSSIGGFSQVTDETVVGIQGDARITVDFAVSSFSGSLDNLTAVNTDSLAVADATGALTLGGIVGDGVPNDLNGTYAGTIGAFGTDYTLAGNLDGKLRGTRVNPGTRSPIKALSLVSAEDSVVESDLLVDIVIVGEN